MTPPWGRSSTVAFFQILGLLLVAAPLTAPGQSKNSAPSGWGASWTQPANEQQRQRQEFARQCNAAQKAHNFQGEVSLCTQAIQKDPKFDGAYVMRAWAFSHLKQFDRTMADMDHAQKIVQDEHHPDTSARLLIFRAHFDELQKDYPAAVNDLEASMKLNQKDPETWNALAWVRATAPDDRLRDGRESVRLAQKAVSLAKTNSYACVDTLASAYAEANDYTRAVETEKRALSLGASQIKDAAVAQKFQQQATERLRLFEQHQPYREIVPPQA